MLLTIHNFRDFGGYETRDGKKVKKGLLFRSGTLANASRKDIEALVQKGIKTIVDLRTPKEVEKKPDRLPKNVKVNYIHIPIKVKKHNESGRIIQLFSLLFGEFKNLDYFEVLKEANREFVTDFKSQFAKVLELVANPKNLPILIHCTGGKDRTGFASSLILHALGVPEDKIMKDYTETNKHMGYLLEEGKKLLRFFSLFGVNKEQFLPLLEAHPEFLGAAYDQIQKDYGNVETYLAEALGFDQSKISNFQSFLLES